MWQYQSQRMSWIMGGLLALVTWLLLVTCAAGGEPVEIAPGESVVVTAGDLAWLVYSPPDGSAPIIVETFRYGRTDENPPLPGDLSVYTTKLADRLNLTGRNQVALMFSNAASQIEKGELQGSTPIVDAVRPAIEAIGADWRVFSTKLFTHLLYEKRLMTQSQWATAYKSVVAGLKGMK